MAWRLYGAQVDRTAAVDAKASFALAIEIAMVGGIVLLTGGHRGLAHIAGWWADACFWVALSSLGLALITVAWVVRPRLRNTDVTASARTDFVFFAQGRSRAATELEAVLRKQDPLPALSRQVIAMSEATRLKHALLQISLTCVLLSGCLLGLAALLKN